MSITLNQLPDVMEITVSGSLTILDAMAIRDQLVLGLTIARGHVVIDLAEVTELDSAGLQLLVALSGALSKPRFRNLSAPVARLARYLNLDLAPTLPMAEDDHGS